MKQCRKCNIELQLYKPSSGPYYICVKCNNISYPSSDDDKDSDSKLGKDEDKTKDAHPSTSLEPNIGNTHLIDIEYDEIDKVVEKGRD